MKNVLIVGLLVLAACNERNVSPPKQEALTVINYLKKEYRVDPQIQRFDSIYIKELIAQNKSLDADSIINSRIRLYSYKPMGLDFIEYYNRYNYRDRSDSDCYLIYLIRDNKTGKYYKDFIEANACMINEDYCSWSSMENVISKDLIKSDVSDEDVKAYNSIASNRIYGENEMRFDNRKMGIQQYLNSVFKFSRPTKSELDSLFYNYDKYLYYRNDTLLSSPVDLYSFLRIQAIKIRWERNYGGLNQRLERLKSQVNLILLQAPKTSGSNLIVWIYKNNSHLRVRRLKITGNIKSTYSYIIDEYQTCF